MALTKRKFQFDTKEPGQEKIHDDILSEIECENVVEQGDLLIVRFNAKATGKKKSHVIISSSENGPFLSKAEIREILKRLG